MKFKMNLRYISLLATATCLNVNASIIINDTGNWSGEIQAQESGFFTYSNGTWTQTGVNTGSETIWTFLDDYSPEISSSGSNTVECEYESVGWVWTGGPDVSDTIDFDTLPEVDHVDISTIEIVNLSEALYTFYIAASTGEVTVEVSGNVTTSWSDSETDSFEVSASSSGTHSTTASGSIAIDSFIEIGGSNQTSITSTVATKATESRTTSESSSSTVAASFSEEIEVQSGQRINVFKMYDVSVEDIDVFYYADTDEDGLADSSTLEEANYQARSDPALGFRAEVN
jgi:hypothetical protein